MNYRTTDGSIKTTSLNERNLRLKREFSSTTDTLFMRNFERQKASSRCNFGRERLTLIIFSFE